MRGVSPVKWGGLDLTTVPPTSPGEGCIALRLEATETQLPIYTPLTHHGEMTGHFQGDIKLQTSQGKMREKLYGKCSRPLPCSLLSAAGRGTVMEYSVCWGLKMKIQPWRGPQEQSGRALCRFKNFPTEPQESRAPDHPSLTPVNSHL